MYKLWLILLLPCIGFSQSFKQVKDTTLLKQKIESMSKNTNSIESDFTQEKNLSMLSEKIVRDRKSVV